MYKTRLVLIIILLTNFNIFSQAEEQITVNDTINNLSTTNDVVDFFSISLSDDELNDDTSASDNISGLLNSSMDIFYRTAAYEFSSSFFKVRGLDSDNAIVHINGIKMNKLYNGRPQWSNWGGLNDVLRNQELSNGSIPLKYNFGGILGSNNINIRASEYGEGGRITYSSSNRSYSNRLMATYNSGMLEKGWAYSLSIGRRWGNEGYQDASFYDSNSAFLSVQKIFNSKHSLNLAAIYAPNRRGKVSPNTQEVYDLKGIKYNEYWGYQDGEKRNSRVKRVVEPIILLNHDWSIDENSSLETSIGYQFGEMGNSRLDYAGGGNPSPAYYQDLPSYFLADTNGPDYEGAYIAREYLYWNKNGGSIALITTTRQIFVSVGVDFNLTLEDYLFSLNSESYVTMAEALRLTKIDPTISGSDQRRLVFFIGDPAMKLAIPEPQIIITKINDTPINEFDSNIRGLDLVNVKGNIIDSQGQIANDYQGELTVTFYDKEIDRTTLGNDGTTDNFGNQILLNFKTLGETLFRGKSSVVDGEFDFDFIVPKDVGMEVDFGKFSFYSKQYNSLKDNNGYDLTVQVGGINENAEEDNLGPEIELFMNDESFINGGITNENPNLIVKLFDENGINTSSGVGHDIVATIDSNQANSYILNDYYQANIDDFQNGTINFPLNNISTGVHTLKLKAWDVYNNSSESEIEFMVFDEDEDLVIDNVLNYPNPFIDYTEFWFNHNSSTPLNVTIQIFTVSGRLVKTMFGVIDSSGNNSLSRDFYWDGRDDFGDKVAKGVYIYKLSVRSEALNKSVSKIEKLVIL